jgi:PhoH-like ATPase
LSRKIFVLDTSVLLYDKNSIEAFNGNNVVITMPVLEELDRFKEKPGVIGEAARHVNRYLDNLRFAEQEGIWKIVPEKDLKIAFDTKALQADEKTELDISRNDNKIIASALRIIKQFPDMSVSLITKDINLRVKCDALGVWAEDYYKDHIAPELGQFKGVEYIDVEKQLVDKFYEDKKLHIDDIDFGNMETYENMFVVASNGSSSFLAMNKKNVLYPLHGKKIENPHIEARNSEQRFAIDALLNPDISLITLTGLAGSGKTFLALMAALSLTNRNVFSEQLENAGFTKQKRIIVTRTLQHVGARDLGYLPGTMQDKMAPWLAPIVDNIRQAFDDASAFESMIESGLIEVAPIPYIRGRTFADCVIIVDEAQNATIHELKTIITRVGQNAKIILLGDIDQIDTPYIDKRSNGLSIVIDKFKNYKSAAHIHLRKGQRSDLATEASNIL